MSRTYDAVLYDNHIQWKGEAPDVSQPVQVRVTVLESPEERALRGKRMADALRALAESDPFADIDDPVEWQRTIRKDRPLPGRDEL